MKYNIKSFDRNFDSEDIGNLPEIIEHLIPIVRKAAEDMQCEQVLDQEDRAQLKLVVDMIAKLTDTYITYHNFMKSQDNPFVMGK